MKKIQTTNNKKIAIGTGGRTIGLTSQSRIKKNRSTLTVSRSSFKKANSTTGARTGCSTCSRSAGKNK